MIRRVQGPTRPSPTGRPSMRTTGSTWRDTLVMKASESRGSSSRRTARLTTGSRIAASSSTSARVTPGSARASSVRSTPSRTARKLLDRPSSTSPPRGGGAARGGGPPPPPPPCPRFVEPAGAALEDRRALQSPEVLSEAHHAAPTVRAQGGVGPRGQRGRGLGEAAVLAGEPRAAGRHLVREDG